MFKIIIAAFLLPAFLIQIVGCYSNSEITINELEQHKKDKIKLVTKDFKEYSLFYDSKNKERNWELADSVIYVRTKKLVTKLVPYSSDYLLGKVVEKVDTTKVQLSSVKELYKHSLNVVETVFITGISIVIGLIFLAGIAFAINPMPI